MSTADKWPLTAAPFRGNRFAWVKAPLLHGFTRYEPVLYGYGRARLRWIQEDNKWGVWPLKCWLERRGIATSGETTTSLRLDIVGGEVVQK